MKVVILAGGRGTRLSEETVVRPKPMVEIGGRPILWHIMKIYSAAGLKDFIICLGYKGYMIKEYFANYLLHESDVRIDVAAKRIDYLSNGRDVEDWRVVLADTGDSSETGGRIRRISPHLEPDEPFCLTYGDGVANIDVRALLDFHRSHGKLATMTAVRPPGRFGVLSLEGSRVAQFEEKPQIEQGYINGGFFVLSPKVLERIPSDRSIWEREPLESLAADGELEAYRHHGFWQPMDTLRERDFLDSAWNAGQAPWKVW
jgi:glucose-1-phosphate cytidylyltransferase